MTWPTLTWPDVEQIVVEGLRDALTGTSHEDAVVGIEVPAPLTLPLVRVQRVGGVADQTHDRARVLVECWADRSDTAADLCLLVRDLLRGLLGTVDGWTVSRVLEVAGPSRIADPVTGTPRHLLTVEVTVRAAAR